MSSIHVIRVHFQQDLYEVFIESGSPTMTILFPAHSPRQGTKINFSEAPWPVKDIITRELCLSDSDSEFDL